jgi:hypothetical protein
MSRFARGVLTLAVCVAVMPLMLLAANAASGGRLRSTLVLATGLVAALVYGLCTAILCSYDLSKRAGWIQILVDLTWSLPNTLFGLVFGNLIYPFFGAPSRDLSDGEGWISYRPRGSDFGVNVKQTLGTVNLGGRGAHEMVHVVQARILGPLYLPLQAASYVVNFFAQILFTATIGAILSLTGVRRKPYLEPPGTTSSAGVVVSRSAVGGFWGWIYYYTVMELWAYGTE